METHFGISLFTYKQHDFDSWVPKCRYPFESKFLQDVSSRICNSVRSVNRVVYDITSKPPGTIEWE